MDMNWLLDNIELDDFVVGVDVPIAWEFYVMKANLLELLFGDWQSPLCFPSEFLAAVHNLSHEFSVRKEFSLNNSCWIPPFRWEPGDTFDTWQLCKKNAYFSQYTFFLSMQLRVKYLIGFILLPIVATLHQQLECSSHKCSTVVLSSLFHQSYGLQAAGSNYVTCSKCRLLMIRASCEMVMNFLGRVEFAEGMAIISSSSRYGVLISLTGFLRGSGKSELSVDTGKVLLSFNYLPTLVCIWLNKEGAWRSWLVVLMMSSFGLDKQTTNFSMKLLYYFFRGRGHDAYPLKTPLDTKGIVYNGQFLYYSHLTKIMVRNDEHPVFYLGVCLRASAVCSLLMILIFMENIPLEKTNTYFKECTVFYTSFIVADMFEGYGIKYFSCYMSLITIAPTSTSCSKVCTSKQVHYTYKEMCFLSFATMVHIYKFHRQHIKVHADIYNIKESYYSGGYIFFDMLGSFGVGRLLLEKHVTSETSYKHPVDAQYMVRVLKSVGSGGYASGRAARRNPCKGIIRVSMTLYCFFVVARRNPHTGNYVSGSMPRNTEIVEWDAQLAVVDFLWVQGHRSGYRLSILTKIPLASIVAPYWIGYLLFLWLIAMLRWWFDPGKHNFNAQGTATAIVTTPIIPQDHNLKPYYLQLLDSLSYVEVTWRTTIIFRLATNEGTIREQYITLAVGELGNGVIQTSEGLPAALHVLSATDVGIGVTEPSPTDPGMVLFSLTKYEEDRGGTVVRTFFYCGTELWSIMMGFLLVNIVLHNSILLSRIRSFWCPMSVFVIHRLTPKILVAAPTTRLHGESSLLAILWVYSLLQVGVTVTWLGYIGWYVNCFKDCYVDAGYYNRKDSFTKSREIFMGPRNYDLLTSYTAAATEADVISNDLSCAILAEFIIDDMAVMHPRFSTLPGMRELEEHMLLLHSQIFSSVAF